MAEEQEPSIEEILASIRQIISDDDEEETPPAKEESQAAVDDVFDLTERVDAAPEPEPESEPTAPEPEAIVPEPEPEPERFEIAMEDAAAEPFDEEPVEDSGDSLLTDSAAAAAFQGFSKLASRASLDRRGTGDTTIEDIVRELMKPMLREWLDIHLPPLIEKVVQNELRKVARRATEED